MVAAETNLFCIQGPSFNSQMIFNINVSLDEWHTMVVETISDIFNLLALELEARVLRLLFSLRLADELFQVVNFFR